MCRLSRLLLFPSERVLSVSSNVYVKCRMCQQLLCERVLCRRWVIEVEPGGQLTLHELFSWLRENVGSVMNAMRRVSQLFQLGAILVVLTSLNVSAAEITEQQAEAILNELKQIRLLLEKQQAPNRANAIRP